MSIDLFLKKKISKTPITVLTCYESWAAAIVEKTNLDAVLVGDSVAMVMHGKESTLGADIEMMEAHTRAVASRLKTKPIIGDLPFLSYRMDLKSNMEAAGKLMRAGAHAVKLEGSKGNLELIRHMVDSGIPVMGHLGLTPQAVNIFGGYKVQGRDHDRAEEIFESALQLQAAGCFSIVLECVPLILSNKITQALKIPSIGIGAGPGTDGQILVWHDLLGLQNEVRPKFVRRYLNGMDLISNAIESYVQDVKSGSFPKSDESFE